LAVPTGHAFGTGRDLRSPPEIVHGLFEIPGLFRAGFRLPGGFAADLNGYTFYAHKNKFHVKYFTIRVRSSSQFDAIRHLKLKVKTDHPDQHEGGEYLKPIIPYIRNQLLPSGFAIGL